MVDEPDPEVTYVPAQRWNWIVLPIIACGFARETTSAASEVFENLITAMGMHLAYRREATRVPAGMLFRED